MCLALPAKITQILANNKAIINLGGVEREISVSLLEQVSVGDYVITHVGYALTLLDEMEAQKTLQMFSEMAEKN